MYSPGRTSTEGTQSFGPSLGEVDPDVGRVADPVSEDAVESPGCLGASQPENAKTVTIARCTLAGERLDVGMANVGRVARGRGGCGARFAGTTVSRWRARG